MIQSAINLAVSNVREIISSLLWYTDVSILKPTGITFDITDRCQLKCMTCTKWKTPPEAQLDELGTEDWKATILKLKQWLGEFLRILFSHVRGCRFICLQ